ncbi:class I SAM-dependent methyltransferase [uncultured Sunxiuqinia sp.]|uniref:class I SAM-dependent methyltransferase n=1 Tax=uncultured Sunxiuqinia sp. TaxID=1573825 RepID=UPI002AA8F715|nr:class I SAM-dependent methyltransferase [uncultured Sunxiuqinia sp.]
MNNFWDERFSSEEYVYGIEPNNFLKEELQKLTPGKILLPGEGEGRNAVFAAKSGWLVTAFDPSIEGKKKAEKLAQQLHVEFKYLTYSYDTIELGSESFDCIGLVFNHMPTDKRSSYHEKLAGYLKPGGALILEGFSKKQINNNTGGPRDIGMLFSKEELQADFGNFSKLEITEQEVVLDEGPFHKGLANVIRLVATK